MKINCPWCQQEYEIEESMIDANVQCGSCGKEFIIKAEAYNGASQKSKERRSAPKKNGGCSFFAGGIFLSYVISISFAAILSALTGNDWYFLFTPLFWISSIIGLIFIWKKYKFKLIENIGCLFFEGSLVIGLIALLVYIFLTCSESEPKPQFTEIGGERYPSSWKKSDDPKDWRTEEEVLEKEDGLHNAPYSCRRCGMKSYVPLNDGVNGTNGYCAYCVEYLKSHR